MPIKRNNENKKPNHNFARYSGIGFEMLGIIILGVWGGQKLDSKFQNTTPVFTIVLSLLAVFAAMYLVLKDFIGKKNV